MWSCINQEIQAGFSKIPTKIIILQNNLGNIFKLVKYEIFTLNYKALVIMFDDNHSDNDYHVSSCIYHLSIEPEKIILFLIII